MQAVNSAESSPSPFHELGHLEPERVLTPRDCELLVRELEDERRMRPEWSKGEAASSRAVYDVATDPELLARVTSLLGPDVMLWGARVVAKAPQREHPWHSDIETWTDAAEPSPPGNAGKFVTVWIGLENTSRRASLRLMSRSHRFGTTVQELRHQHGRERSELSDREILAWAKQRDARSEIVAFDVTDGDALIFDGCLWHASVNGTSRKRKALLLQYATPGVRIRIPDLEFRDWPFRFLDARPPCLMVHGTDKLGVNRMIDAPPAASDGARPASQPASLPAPTAATRNDGTQAAPHAASSRLRSRIHRFDMPLAPDAKTGWKPYRCFLGETRGLDLFTAHASALAPRKCPHPPHRHLEEELLLVLDGEVEVDLPDVAQRPRLARGDVVYYPATFAHTVTAVSDAPASYFMVKWCDRAARSVTEPTMAYGRFNWLATPDPAAHVERKNGFSFDIVFQGPTLFLRKLHCHYTTLAPGGGYEPHADAYEVVLLIVEGEVETLGERVGPHGVVYYAAGEPHGIRNPGAVPAKYLVFEFHDRRSAAPVKRASQQSLASKLVDPAAWKRLLANLRPRG
jgi:uncharacterized cupin superfamily protein